MRFSLFSAPPVAEMILRVRHPQYFPLNPPLVFFFFFFLAAVAGWALRKERWAPWAVLLSSLGLVLWFYGDKAHEISEIKSTRSLAQVVKENAGKEYRVIAIRPESLPFYLPHHVSLVAHPGVVESLLQEPIPTVALVKEKHLREINHLPHSRFFIWKAIPSGGALIANFPFVPAHDSGGALKH